MSRLDREWIALGFHEDEEKIIPVIRMSGIDKKINPGRRRCEQDFNISSGF